MFDYDVNRKKGAVVRTIEYIVNLFRHNKKLILLLIVGVFLVIVNRSNVSKLREGLLIRFK